MGNDDDDDDTVVADTLSGGAGANDIDCVVVLVGVEHTIDCFRDDELLDDVTNVFTSVFVARTAVGFTGYKTTQNVTKSINRTSLT